MSRSFVVSTATLVLAAACADLPAGFDFAEGIEVVQAECTGEISTLDADPWLEVDGTSRSFEGTLHEAMFRCGQDACGFLKVDGETSKVLFQPCEMTPFGYPLRGVAACDCVYDLAFTARAEPGSRVVEAYARGDSLSGSHEARLLDSASVVVDP